ncbi:MAG: TIGR00341 family protein [Myxococcales bacterium]|jgi:uncharacterized hydrophobic protein (TIGR00341 family)
MALRLVEVLVPAEVGDAFLSVVDGAGYDAPLAVMPEDGRLEYRLLVHAEHTGPLVDAIEKRFGNMQGFNLLILDVQAALPRRETESRSEADAEAAPPDAEAQQAPRLAGTTGISREELYHDVLSLSTLDRTFIATVVFSTLVAAVGMLRDNVAVVIGAMVIAPLLGPNVALALATTLGDTTLLRRSATAGVAGVALAIALSVAMGAVLHVDPTLEAISSRTTVELSDIVLALASGGAAVLALTRGISSALVGVMVAVALLPPTVTMGLMAGSGRGTEMLHAGMLLLTNVICVNLAGVVTFLVQGVRPLRWWEASRARRSQRLAIAIWLGLLVILGALIVASGRTR